MALDTRRAYHQNKDTGTSMRITGNTLPAMLLIAFGLILLIVCIILMAAFGLPTKVNEKPEQVGGPACAAGGIIFCIIGGLYASKLKKERQMRAKQQRVRPSVSNERGYTNRAYTGTTSNTGGVYTTQQHHKHQQQQQYYYQQQQNHHQPQVHHHQQQYARQQYAEDPRYGYASDVRSPASISHK